MKKQQTERKVLINFEAPESLRDAIRIYCAKNKVTMRRFLDAASTQMLRTLLVKEESSVPYIAIDSCNSEMKEKLRKAGINLYFE